MRIDTLALVRYVRALGKATAAGALGYWLECEQKRLGRPGVPRSRRFARSCRLQPRICSWRQIGRGKDSQGDWNVILPVDVLERRFEGL